MTYVLFTCIRELAFLQLEFAVAGKAVVSLGGEIKKPPHCFSTCAMSHDHCGAVYSLW